MCWDPAPTLGSHGIVQRRGISATTRHTSGCGESIQSLAGMLGPCLPHPNAKVPMWSFACLLPVTKRDPLGKKSNVTPCSRRRTAAAEGWSPQRIATGWTVTGRYLHAPRAPEPARDKRSIGRMRAGGLACPNWSAILPRATRPPLRALQTQSANYATRLLPPPSSGPA